MARQIGLRLRARPGAGAAHSMQHERKRARMEFVGGDRLLQPLGQFVPCQRRHRQARSELDQQRIVTETRQHGARSVGVDAPAHADLQTERGDECCQRNTLGPQPARRVFVRR